MIVVDSRFLDSTLAKLLGLKFKDFYTSTDNFQVTQEHYITRDIAAGNTATPAQSRDYSDRIWVPADERGSANSSGSTLEVSLDDTPTKMRAEDFDHETLTIDLPSGLGTHVWALRAAKNSKDP